MQKLVAGCPELGERAEFARIANLRSIDCIATRLWFDRRVATQFPANVLSGFEECTGGTWFNLNDLQVRLTFPFARFPGLACLASCMWEECTCKVERTGFLERDGDF